MICPFREGELELSLSTLASRKKIHLSTVHRWRQRGKLDAYRLGGRWFVTVASWEKFVDRCNGGAGSPDTPATRSSSQKKRDEAEAARRCIALGC